MNDDAFLIKGETIAIALIEIKTGKSWNCKSNKSKINITNIKVTPPIDKKDNDLEKNSLNATQYP